MASVWDDGDGQEPDFSSIKRQDDEAPPSWEDMLDDEPEEKPKETKAAVEKPKPKSKKKEDSPVSDPVLERIRQQKLVEDGDRDLVDDLFSGCDRENNDAFDHLKSFVPDPENVVGRKAATDPYEEISMKTFTECEVFAEKISAIIRKSPAKSPAWLRLLDLLLKECSTKMEMKDLKSLHAKVFTSIKAREKELLSLAEKKKKPNDVGSQIKNYKEEYDMFYGGGDGNEDEEDEDEEEDDLF